MNNAPFRLSRVSGQAVSDAELLADLKRVSQLLKATTVSEPRYREHGTYDDTTVIRRFGSWNKALLAAGLTLSNEINIPDERLFENLFLLWQHYGRQPRRSELAQRSVKHLAIAIQTSLWGIYCRASGIRRLRKLG